MKHFLVSEELMKATLQALPNLPMSQVRTLVLALEECPSVNVTKEEEPKPEPKPE